MIGEITTDSTGAFAGSGSTELNMDLPNPRDGNFDTWYYGDAPWYYDPGYGAKLWIVPSEDYDSATCTVSADFDYLSTLFETGLIWYTDTNIKTNNGKGKAKGKKSIGVK